jgi:hypothetical protein
MKLNRAAITRPAPTPATPGPGTTSRERCGLEAAELEPQHGRAGQLDERSDLEHLAADLVGEERATDGAAGRVSHREFFGPLAHRLDAAMSHSLSQFLGQDEALMADLNITMDSHLTEQDAVPPRSLRTPDERTAETP